MKLILSRGVALVLGGLIVGVLAAFALTRMMRTVLYGVARTDPLSYAAAALAIATVAGLACYIPARRAMGVDPIVALRSE
jgi:ABC-type antimicrobial peptide transport system permease subunit